MSLILAVIILTGPPQPSGATIPLRIHLGRDARSKIIAAELANPDEFFWSRRLKIETNYRIVTDDDALDEPTYQLGRGDERHRFRQGSFAASGTFIVALQSIAEIDRWERENPFLNGPFWAEEEEMSDWVRMAWLEQRQSRPEPFPPENGP